MKPKNEAIDEVNVSIVPIVARNTDEKNEVVVAAVPVAFTNERFAIVPFVAERFVEEALDEKKFVEVELTDVAFVTLMLERLRFPAERF